MSVPPDRRRALFPEPPEPGAEQEEFAPYPRRITQPDVATGLLEGGQAPRVKDKPPREGEELRPPTGPFPTDEGYVVRHEHHHVVETFERPAAAHRATRIKMDPALAPRGQQLLARDSGRKKATVLNLSSSTSTVTIGNEAVAAGDINGFDLAPGTSLDVTDEDWLWGSIPVGGAATVNIWATRMGPDRGHNQD